MKKILLALALVSFGAVAQPIKLVVPFAAGGPAGIIAAAIQQPLEQELGRQVVIEYVTGAGGTIGTKSVINSSKKETVLLIHSSSFVLNSFRSPALYKETDLKPIAYFGKIPFVLVTSKKSQLTTLSQWKQSTRQISYGSGGGTGAATHVVGEYFNQFLQKNLLHVPYNAAAGTIIIDLYSGDLDSSFLFANNAIAHVQQQRINAIGVLSDRRLINLPEVPTTKELGMLDTGDLGWLMLFSNDSENQSELDSVQTAMVKILNSDQYKKLARTLELQLSPSEIIPALDFISSNKHKVRNIMEKIQWQ